MTATASEEVPAPHKHTSYGRALTTSQAHFVWLCSDAATKGSHRACRDGENNNLSWNCGEEGETTNPSVTRLRARQMRNLAAALLLAHGVPMIQMGDEYGHSKVGRHCCVVCRCGCQHRKGARLGGCAPAGSWSAHHSEGDKYGHSIVDWSLTCTAFLYVGQHQLRRCLSAQGMLMIHVGNVVR